MRCVVGGNLLFDFSDHHFDAFRLIGAGVGEGNCHALNLLNGLGVDGKTAVFFGNDGR